MASMMNPPDFPTLLKLTLGQRSWRLVVAVVTVMTAVAGCTTSQDQEVIVYAALDEEFSRPILEEFTKQSGIAVRAKYDVESTKSVQLTQAILAERDRPRCDVFWNNELINTLRLEEAGLLATYQSPIGKQYPPAYRSADGSWHGFAARARVLIVNTDLVPAEETPQSILDLTDPKWQGQAAIAKPLAGTTATHAAVLFSMWGDDRAKEFFRDVRRNARVLGGNKQVARAVADGAAAFGLTDTDDAIIEVERGTPVKIVYPDQGDDQFGTLFIPNTLAIVKGCLNRQAAQALVDYLLSPAVERALAAGPSAQIPLNPEIDDKLRVETPATVRAMQVDFAVAARQWEAVALFIRDEFATAD